MRAYLISITIILKGLIVLSNAGRPIEWTEEKIQDTIEKLNKYIDDNEIPIVAEFAYLHNIRKATLYEKPQLKYAIKRLTEKKEAQLEKGALAGLINSTMAIFSLKQMGWNDKQQIEHSGNDEKPVMVSLGDILANSSKSE